MQETHMTMSDLSKILLTSSLTVISGVLVFTVGQVIVRFVIEPLQERAKLVGQIADSLIYYANVYSNPNQTTGPEAEEAKRILRQHASQLLSKTHAIPCYCLVEGLGGIRASCIEKASKELIGLSNSVSGDARVADHNYQRRKNITKLLRLRIEAPDPISPLS